MADFFIMNFALKDIDRAIKNAGEKITPLADCVKNDLQLKNDNLFIVGGFVRDNVLAQLTNKENTSKDLDLMLPQKPDLKNNKNIVWFRQNSLGGMKIGTTHFNEIDIFQQNVDSPDLIVCNNFDFNCNALYYSLSQKQIFASAYFYDFILNNKIDLEHVIFDKDKIKILYPEYSVVSRALKFQIQFKEKYGINVNLSSNIMYILYNLDKESEQKMFDYTKQKAKSEVLKNKIIGEYQRLRYK